MHTLLPVTPVPLICDHIALACGWSSRRVNRLRRHRNEQCMSPQYHNTNTHTKMHVLHHTPHAHNACVLHCHVGGTVAALTDSAVTATNCTMPSNSVSAFLRLYDEPHIRFARARLCHQVCPPNIHGMSASADTANLSNRTA